MREVRVTTTDVQILKIVLKAMARWLSDREQTDIRFDKLAWGDFTLTSRDAKKKGRRIIRATRISGTVVRTYVHDLKVSARHESYSYDPSDSKKQRWNHRRVWVKFQYPPHPSGEWVDVGYSLNIEGTYIVGGIG
ncbi:MAG: hypothetical protein WA021_02045 [Minisyncoccia bacterium]